MSKKILLKFDEYEWRGLEAADFLEGLVTLENDCIYYNGEYICPLCVPHVALYFALRAYCKGYKIGFQAGDDSRADYDSHNYIMIDKSTEPQDLSDFDDLYIPKELRK